MILEEQMSNEEILKLIEAKSNGTHRCLSGRVVKIGSQECQKDILKRIEDICHHRDTSDYGSDARVYFSGVLRVLRRKLRENDKIMLGKAEKKKNSKRIVEMLDIDLQKNSARLLNMSGIM